MYRYRGYRRRDTARRAALAGAAVVLLAGAKTAAHHHHSGPAGPAAQTVIAYARHELGKPYCWGGTGGSCYDCSGLTMEAYAQAGITIPRTSQEQWAELRHVSRPRPGDLVFFPGADGSWTSPGHVAIVIGHHRMIQAYATGYPIMVSPLNGDGAGGIIGYARPGGSG